MKNAENLKKILNSKSILKIGGAYDALSAKLVETSGFDAIWAGSFAISATHALPDASILTMTDFLRVAENMVDSCNIPVIADCDTGFGGPANVSHAVKKYEKSPSSTSSAAWTPKMRWTFPPNSSSTATTPTRSTRRRRSAST